MLINYRSNNSGGRWWLTDDDWHKLEKAGWKVEWVAKEDHSSSLLSSFNVDGRFLGALAKSASKEFETPGEAMREFEAITDQTVSDEGCNCCGAPHEFSWGEGEKRGYASGNDCLEHLYKDVPTSLREACEKLN